MIRVQIRIEGLRETLRVLSTLPQFVQNQVRDKSFELSEDLADKIKAAGTADTRQSAIAARTVRARRDRFPVVEAGKTGPKVGRAVLLGSEFGATRRFGWYAAGRYYDHPNKQFRPHRGADSYWFFKCFEQHKERILNSYVEVLDDVARRWAN